MQISKDNSNAHYQITAYDEDAIYVGKEILRESFIIAPSALITIPPRVSLNNLTQEMLDPVITLQPDILLIGTGKCSATISPLLASYLETHQINVECMNTFSACRSYTLLLAEQRKVVAMLFL